jgi:RNA polymerase sigma factor (sigma-70 family)
LCDFPGRRLSSDEVDHAADSAARLREFIEHRSEKAFAALVRDHLNLVYSVALRRCGGQTGMAQDICQTVFTDFARKAAALPADGVVAGWLYQHASYVASTMLRAEDRRRRREGIAMQLRSLADDTDWHRLAPLLDDALLELEPSDRDPLVLRFLEQRPLAEVGSSLGLSENTARMRVERALDKLRAKLAKRGVTSTASALAVAMAGPAVTAAPATLAATITTVALAAAATSSAFGLLSLMASTKLKITVAAAVLAAAGTALVLQHQAGNQLRADNADLQRSVAQLTEEAQAARQAVLPPTQESSRQNGSLAELLRLRGEVARLQQQAIEPKPAATASAKAAPPAMADRHGEPFVVGGDFVPVEQWGNAGSTTPEAAAMTMMWALLSKNLQLMNDNREPLTEEFKRYLAENNPRALNEEIMLEQTASMLNGVQAMRANVLKTSLEKPDEAHLELVFKRHPSAQGVETITMPLKSIGGRWRMGLPEIPAAKP